jgi:3-hydroxyisobutyrate dehydrogenase-like beta-hydroxyacid dehydrogenase
MGVVVAIVAQGMMGAGIGTRLCENGVEVRTLLKGRSAESAARAKKAGMIPARDEKELLDEADYFLSILPPGEALALAQRLAPALFALEEEPLYLDCNAVSPQTAARIAAVIVPTGARFVDAGIIGGPPQRDTRGPTIYLSGEHAGEALPLRDFGLDLRAIEGGVGAASGLKMSYAGITKGTTAIAAAMLLGAARFGSEKALLAELEASQPQLLARFRAAIPSMYDKAYRWVAEMEEISTFLEESPPSRALYAAIARLYEDLAAAQAEAEPSSENLTRTLERVLGR